MQPCAFEVLIQAPPRVVWEALTDPSLMKAWMGDPELEIDVKTDWIVGGPIVIRGFHHVQFENKGTVLHFEPPRRLRYTHLSSVSGLPDEAENHSVFDFDLAPIGADTSLTVRVSGFPTEPIFKHLELYWRITADILKQFAELRVRTPASPA